MAFPKAKPRNEWKTRKVLQSERNSMRPERRAVGQRKECHHRSCREISRVKPGPHEERKDLPGGVSREEKKKGASCSLKLVLN